MYTISTHMTPKNMLGYRLKCSKYEDIMIFGENIYF